MFNHIEAFRRAKRKIPLLWIVIPVIFALSLPGFPAQPAHAGNAPSTYKLVQCDSGGVVTNDTAITGVDLPIQYDSSGNFHARSVDAAIFSGGTLVTEQDGFNSTRLKIGLGAVTNYDYDAATPVVYEIKFRGHYAVGVTQDITENWQSSGLYFQVIPPSVGGQSSAKDITVFTVSGQVGSSTIDTINHAVTFHMPFGTNVSALAPAITVSADATVSPTSGTPENFSSPVTYTVTAQDSSTQQWTATCIVDPGTHTVSVSANPPAGGSVSGGGTYNEGASVTVTASVYSGYNFVNWTEGGTVVSPNASYTFTLTADRTLVANFITPGGGGGGSGGGSSTPQPVDSTTGSALVIPSVGGKVSLGGDAAIQIPAGALRGSEGVMIEVTKVTAPPTAPSGFTFPGNTCRLTVGGSEHYQFNQPVTLTFTFDPSTLKPGEKPEVCFYDEASKQWVSLGGTVSGSTITVTVDHFTMFAVLVKSAKKKPAVNLTDIAGHWAENNIKQLVARGVISGYPDGTFKPDQTITRAEFAAVLVKAFKLEARSSKVFADTTGHWAKGYIATAAVNGIVNGYDLATFGPDDPITREQMAVMVVRAAKLTIVSEEMAFADSTDISAWARDYVACAVQNRIIKGYPDNSFKPLGSATRAEAVVIISGVLK